MIMLLSKLAPIVERLVWSCRIEWVKHAMELLLVTTQPFQSLPLAAQAAFKVCFFFLLEIRKGKLSHHCYDIRTHPWGL